MSTDENVVQLTSKNCEPGVILTYSGRRFDLQNPDIKQIFLDDIAWSLAQQVRYNGHIPHKYTVARHSIIMSYYVDPEHAMEALLHDAGEAYMSDIVHPLKVIFPILESMEDRITTLIMQKYHPTLAIKGGTYKKSPDIDEADFTIYKHECWRFDRPAGVKCDAMEEAEEMAILNDHLEDLEMYGNSNDYFAFLHRFWTLFETMYERNI